MLQRLNELARQRADFAFETTLASRTFAPWIVKLVEDGYAFYLVYVWVLSPKLSIARVAERVQAGGHHVPDEVVRRRYAAGLRNFFTLYRPHAESWRVYDNSRLPETRLIAEGQRSRTRSVYDRAIWRIIRRGSEHADV